MVAKKTTKKAGKATKKTVATKRERHAGERKSMKAKARPVPANERGVCGALRAWVASLPKSQRFTAPDAQKAVPGLESPMSNTYLSLLQRQGVTRRISRGVYVRAGRG